MTGATFKAMVVREVDAGRFVRRIEERQVGVGSLAVALLSALGYRIVAATGKPQEAEYLRGLGAEGRGRIVVDRT